THATLDGGVHVGRAGLRIGRVQKTRTIECDAARTPPLFPLGDELPLLVEDLDAAVAAIRNEKASLRIEDEAVRRLELARSRSLLAPRLDELSFLVELDDARVAGAAGSI